MKLLWRLGREAIRYKGLYVIAILATLALTFVNLAAPRVLSGMTALVAEGVTREALRQIGLFTLTLCVLYLMRVLFRFLSNYLAHKAAWSLVEDMRIRVYDKIQSLSMRYFHDKQTGDLMSRVINDTATFELLYAHIIPESITNVVTVTGVMIILLTINVKLALLTCIPIPFILLSGVIFAKKIRPNFREAQQAVAGINAKIQDNFSGIHEIQSFSQEENEAQAVASRVGVFTKAMLHALKLSSFFHPSVEFLSAAGTIIVVGFGGLLAFWGEISVSDIVAFLLYLSLFYAPVSGLAKLLEDMQQAFAGAERVMAVMDQEQEIRDEPGAKAAGRLQGAIEFKNVCFAYDEAVPILKDVSFQCK
ncbi:MAG: ABC transporter ATP-binding protein, partial [Oscillospiraceae bacterium]|nr:ABC transporter ATP-binding protein [Oscillospiraceae bacterium]